MITSFRHDNARRAQQKKYVGILIGVLVLFVIFRSPLGSLFSGVVQAIGRPLWIAEGYVGDLLHRSGYFFTSKRALLAENDRLQDALDLVSLESYSRQLLQKENESLKAVLGRHAARELLLARVLASPGWAPYDTLIIDVGAHEGMIAGMRVFSDGDFAIGEITRVFAESAVVTLYSSSGNEIPVTVGATSTPTIAYGMGGGNFRITLPKGIEVVPGDLIEIPSFAPMYAGVVESVRKSEGSSLQDIYFKWPMNISTLRFVYIAASEDMSSSGRATATEALTNN